MTVPFLRSALCAMLLTIAGTASAQDVKFEFHGFVGGSVYSEDAGLSSGGGGGAWHVTSAPTVDKGVTGGDVRQTRLNFSLTGPQIFEGATPRAFAELDFFGNTGEGAFGDISLTPRLRIAFAELKLAKTKTMVRAGQDHDLILGIVLPATVGHVAFPLSYNAGTIGWRRPGVGVYQTVPVSNMNLELAATVGKANWRSGGVPGTGTRAKDDVSTEDLDETGQFLPIDSSLVGLGAASGLPAFQARAKLTGKIFEAFVAGYFSRIDANGQGASGGANLDTTAVTAGGKVSYLGATLAGAGYTGKNLGPLAGNLLQWQPTAAVAKEIDVNEIGAWAQLGYNITPTLSVWGLAGLANPSDEDLKDASLTRSRNVTTSGMLRYQSKGYAGALEYAHFETKYTDKADTLKANQLMLSGMYFF